MKKNLDMKIGIIGAGVAGLTAAEALRGKGYKNIILFEKEIHAGGKCRSIEYEGRSYELGAGVVAENYRTVRELAKKFAVKMTRINFTENILLDIKTGKLLNKKTSLSEKLSFLFQILKYRKLCRRFQKNEEPGLSDRETDLYVPFSKQVEHWNIPLVAKELELFFTGFGYGYFNEVPTAYVLKHYSWETVKSFMQKSIYKFPHGIQGLWTAIAKTHSVFYRTTIKAVRRGDAVKIQTEDGEHTVDALILTGPLDEALRYLDATHEEKILFSKIEYNDYRTFACLVKNFPKKGGYLPGNFNPSRKGHPVFWYLRYPDSDLYTFYVMGDEQISDEEIMKNIEVVVHQLGGAIEKNLTVVHWKCFPHVSIKEMKNGYFDTLESLQEKNHTYYAGELLNFSTVEHSAAYSARLVERYF